MDAHQLLLAALGHFLPQLGPGHARAKSMSEPLRTLVVQAGPVRFTAKVGDTGLTVKVETTDTFGEIRQSVRFPLSKDDVTKLAKMVEWSSKP